MDLAAHGVRKPMRCFDAYWHMGSTIRSSRACVRRALMAPGQRPVRNIAGNEASGSPAWKSIPSWFVFGEHDKNIPFAAYRFMAKRAWAREIVEIEDASHAVGVSHPEEATDTILRVLKDVA